jgi:protein FAM173B
MSEILMIIGGAVGAMFLLTVLVGAPYVPTHSRQFRRLLHHLRLNPQTDVLVDLGAGDGKIVRLSAPYVKLALGYEINPALVALAKLRTRRFQNVRIKLADFRQIQLPAETTVVYIFSAGTFLKQVVTLINSHLQQANRPLTVISYGFEMPDLGQPEVYQGFLIYHLGQKSTSKKPSSRV